MEKDIRWEQRFANYRKALHKLTQAVEYIKGNFPNAGTETENTTVDLDEIIKEGLIQRFEYTHELAWNVMKEYAEYQGTFDMKGSRDATRQGFKMKLFTNGEIWMDMIKSRNSSSHTYNEETADEIYTKIISLYYPAFVEFEKNMDALRSGHQEKLFEL